MGFSRIFVFVLKRRTEEGGGQLVSREYKYSPRRASLPQGMSADPTVRDSDGAVITAMAVGGDVVVVQVRVRAGDFFFSVLVLVFFKRSVNAQ